MIFRYSREAKTFARAKEDRVALKRNRNDGAKEIDQRNAAKRVQSCKPYLDATKRIVKDKQKYLKQSYGKSNSITTYKKTQKEKTRCTF